MIYFAGIYVGFADKLDKLVLLFSKVINLKAYNNKIAYC